MRTLIVDDEAPARARLRRLLARFPRIEIVGEARDGHEALELAAALAPELVFIDIQMPGPSGLDVAASLPDPAPHVVFVTAHDQYAVQAFEAAAIDYLLKPVEPERLDRTMARIGQRQPLDATTGSIGPARPATFAPAHLLIPDRGRTHVLAIAEITWLEAADNYVVVHAGTRAPLLRRTLTALLDDLGEAFIRTHRSLAVAVAHIAEVRPREHGDSVVVLRDGVTVACSRQYRAALLARLEVAP